MGMRRVRVGCEFVHVAAVDTPAVLQVEPQDAAPVSLARREWSTEPAVRIRHYTDLYGNLCARAMLPAGRSTLRFDASVLVPDATEDADEQAPELPPEELPDEVLIYTLPSRYCLSDVLADKACELFGGIAPGWERVQAICDYVHGHLQFGYGSSTSTTVPAKPNGAGGRETVPMVICAPGIACVRRATQSVTSCASHSGCAGSPATTARLGSSK